MTPRTQRNLAIAAAITVVAVFVAANAHLLTVAFWSQPACVLAGAGHVPAQRVC